MDFGAVKQLISGGGIAIDRGLSSNVQLESILTGDENTEVDRAVTNLSFRLMVQLLHINQVTDDLVFVFFKCKDCVIILVLSQSQRSKSNNRNISQAWV